MQEGKKEVIKKKEFSENKKKQASANLATEDDLKKLKEAWEEKYHTT